MQSDRPIDAPKLDRLGFGAISEQLASAVLQNDFNEGFVIGIEGAWGSGKSSIANLVISRLKEEKISTVEFSPWLVGNRDAMIVELFKALRVALKTEPKALEALKKFSDVAARLSPLATLADEWGVPGSKLAGKALDAASSEAGRFSSESMGKAKAAITSALENLDSPVVIFVDDLDRLDPTEAVEVLRLVRAVTDFPNVIYILAYDLEVLARNIEATLKVPDGRSFLEKIVQVSFRVPDADPFDLKNWFGSEAFGFFENWDVSETATGRLQQLLGMIVPSWLDTPRNVIRILNNLKLYAAPLKNQVDPADIVFLQTIRTVDPEFYGWLRQYMPRLIQSKNYPFGRDEAEKIRMEGVKQIFEKRASRIRPSAIYLKQFIPGVDWYALSRLGDDIDWTAALQLNYDDGIAEKRWFSPEHHRLYTSYSKPAGSFDDDDLSSFLDALANDPDSAAARFSEFAGAERAQGGVMADVVLERLRTLLSSEMPPSENALIGLVGVLAQVGDTLPSKDFFPAQDQGAKVAQQAIALLPANSKRETLLEVSRHGQALGLLVRILRNQSFRHGNEADPSQEVPIQERELTPEEFSIFRQELLWRIEILEPEKLLARDDLNKFLYAWFQDGKPDAIRSWIARQSVTDENFIHLIERIILNSGSSDTLNALKKFFGHDRTLERLKRLKDGEKSDLASRSDTVLRHIEFAKYF